MSDTTNDPQTPPADPVGNKFESSTAHAKAALDETTTAAKEVYEVGKKRAQSAFASTKDHLTQAAKDFSDAANVKYQEVRSQAVTKAEEYKGKAREALSDATTKAQNVQGDTEQYIRDNPLQAVGIALGVGFVLGLIMRK